MVQWLSALVSNLPQLSDTAGWLLGLPTPLIMVTLTFALLFKFLPPVPLRWRDVSLAAVLCAVAWLIAAEFLALYGVLFGDSFTAQGAIGGVLMIMLWMYVVSQLLFYGGELCKVIARRNGFDEVEQENAV